MDKFKKTIIITVATLIAGVIFLVAYIIYYRLTTVKVTIETSPKEAEVLSGFSWKKTPAIIRLKKGENKIRIKKDNYETKEEIITLTKEGDNKYFITLGGGSKKYINSEEEPTKIDLQLDIKMDLPDEQENILNEEDTLNIERRTGAEIDANTEKFYKENELANSLPYKTDQFQLDFTVNENNPNGIEYIATAYYDQEQEKDSIREAVSAWIKEKGINPSLLNIKYDFIDGGDT